MAHYEIDLPPVPAFRTHINMTLRFVQTYLLAAELRNYPYEAVEKIITKEFALALEEKIIAAGGENPVQLAGKELLAVYAAHDISNKVLVSQYGEEIGEGLLQYLSDGHHLKNFIDYRTFCIKCNDHMIKDIDTKMPDLDGLALLKIQLSNLVIN